MRLTDWRSKAPTKDAMSPKVLAVIEPALGAMGGDSNPECWVAWGDDPDIRYMILVPHPAGLITCGVRINVPGEGPHASAKLVRWNRVQLGEMAVETQGAHRLISFQVEGTVLRGADAAADQIGAFAHALFAAVDGRAAPSTAPARRGKTPAAAGGKASGPAGKPATAKAPSNAKTRSAPGQARPLALPSGNAGPGPTGKHG